MAVAPEVDPQRPSVARIYDYFLGGRHNFAADRQAAAVALAAMPQLPAAARINRDFLRRAVTTAAEAGVDQFLDLGAGIPAEGAAGENVPEMARRIRPHARVVYVDLEPVAVVHARRLLAADPYAEALLADLTEPGAVLDAEPVRRLIDLARPVCLLATAVADFIPDTELLGRALDQYREAAAPGSFLVMSHGSAEGDPERVDQVRRIYNTTTSPMVIRNRDEVRALMGDWPLIDPGLTLAARWRPDGAPAEGDPVATRSVVAAVARKPTVT